MEALTRDPTTFCFRVCLVSLVFVPFHVPVHSNPKLRPVKKFEEYQSQYVIFLFLVQLITCGSRVNCVHRDKQ